MNSQLSFSSLSQVSSLHLRATRTVYDARSSYDEQVLRRFLPLPIRRRIEEAPIAGPRSWTPIRQPATSTSHDMGMFDNPFDNEETMLNASSLPNNDSIARRLTYKPTSKPGHHCIEQEAIVQPRSCTLDPQPIASTSHDMGIFDNLSDDEEMRHNASTFPNIDLIAKHLNYKPPSRPGHTSLLSYKDLDKSEPFARSFQSTSPAFGDDEDVNFSLRLNVTPSVPHSMINWTRDVTAEATSLPYIQDSRVTSSASPNNISGPSLALQIVKGHHRGARRRQPRAAHRPLVLYPKHSDQATSCSSGDEADVDEPGPERRESVDVLLSMLPSDTNLLVSSTGVMDVIGAHHHELPEGLRLKRPLLREPCRRFVKRVRQ